MATKKAIQAQSKVVRKTVKQKVVNRAKGDDDDDDVAGGVGYNIEKMPENLELTGDLELDMKNERTLIREALAAADKNYYELQQLHDNTQFWFCVVFESTEQKLAFLKAMKWTLASGGDTYLDGIAIARFMGIELPLVGIEPKKSGKGKRAYDDLIDENLD